MRAMQVMQLCESCKKSLIGQGCLRRPRVFRKMPKCVILKVHLKAILKRKKKLKSKSKLPRVTIKGLGNPLIRVSKVAQER